jgi:2-polyprenyl-3-methyl-5-hydroxy-6-metoxy-1,4-benzoquinol methylase
MMDVVEHVPDPDGLLAHARRLVRPGGALVLLTPDAGAPLSRVLGRRWPEVQRPGEHVVLYSRRGLVSALARHGFVASGWHTTGKVATVSTLLDDAATIAPSILRAAQRGIAHRAVGRRVVELDPHTKFVLYARRDHDHASDHAPDHAPDHAGPSSAAPTHPPARVPKAPERVADVDDAILTELEHLASAWLFDTFEEHVPGARVLEVGGGIGTFTARLLTAGATHVHVIEPETSCAGALEDRFAADARVTIARDELPGAPSLVGADGTFDLVVCQNVLEHIGDDASAIQAMAAALRPGGHLALVVPAGPALFGALDDAYGHWRRYDEAMVRSVIGGAGLDVETMRHLNVLGIPGWWAKNRRPGARVGAGSLRAYEALVRVWRPLEERWSPRFGLTIACTARKGPAPLGTTDGPEYAAAR